MAATPKPSDGDRRVAERSVGRRSLVRVFGAALALMLLAGCGDSAKWHSIDVTGSLPPLAFTMTRAADGKEVTQSNYRGRIVLLYFGYTNCPDVCPTTLSNLADTLTRIGPDAQHVRMLFVTVDPKRDTPPVLAAYVKNFAPQIEGLRGTADQLAALARRYRVVYSVSPATEGHPYEVTHSSAIYVFDGSGAARLIIGSLSSTHPDIAGTAADLKRLVEARHPGLLSRLLRLV
ncbi:MAG TPA: SCO family protein [Stellaceae bacterium]|jgi:protein SCO1/2